MKTRDYKVMSKAAIRELTDEELETDRLAYIEQLKSINTDRESEAIHNQLTIINREITNRPILNARLHFSSLSDGK